MQFYHVLLAVLAIKISLATSDSTDKVNTCSDSVGDICSSDKTVADSAVFNCNANYAHINVVEKDLQKYVNQHILSSFKYLLMSTHFGNYKDQRLGFEKFFRSLSDRTWNDAIDLIKYLTKRGRKMNFAEEATPIPDGSEYNEFKSLSLALDIQKSLALDANAIHSKINKNNEAIHDPEVSDYLEKHQIHELSEDIREISGYANDFHKLLDTTDPSLNIYLFDEYLQKV